jgi:hypothetical protein
MQVPVWCWVPESNIPKLIAGPHQSDVASDQTTRLLALEESEDLAVGLNFDLQ